mgnify:CR=1 FL=1
MYYLAPLSGFGAAEDIQENAAIPVDDILVEDFIQEEEATAPASSASPPEEDEVVREEITSDEWMIPSSLATQIFSIVPGIAGGLAGFVLASKLSNAKSVKATEVLMASGSVALITFLSVFLVKTIDEFE